jgi:hypothetical protein
MAKSKAQYIGERLNVEKIVHAFLFEEEEIYFAKAKYCTLGNMYEVAMRGEIISIHTTPKDLGEGPMTDEQRDEWQAEELKAHQFLRRKRQANSIKNNPKVLQVARELKPLLKSLSFSGKKELLEFIIDELEKESREEISRARDAQLKRVAKKYGKAMRAAQKT